MYSVIRNIRGLYHTWIYFFHVLNWGSGGKRGWFEDQNRKFEMFPGQRLLAEATNSNLNSRLQGLSSCSKINISPLKICVRLALHNKFVFSQRAVPIKKKNANFRRRGTPTWIWCDIRVTRTAAQISRTITDR